MKGIIQWVRRARLRDWVWLVRRLVPHVAIVLSGMLIVFFLIDRVNKPISFMTNEFHKVITFILSLLAIGLSARVMAVQRREEWERYRRLKQRQEQAARQTGYGYGYADRPRPGRASAVAPRRAAPVRGRKAAPRYPSRFR